MSRILLLMDHKENRRILAEWLASRYTVLPQQTDEAVDEEYDLGILDGTALDRLADRIQDRKKYQQTVFLPFLLVTAEQHVGLVTRHLWTSIDEVIRSPIDKVELQARIEVLLRARKQAVALRQSGERALRQSEERLGLLIEGVPDYALFLIDPSGNVSGWNAGAERLLGYEAEEIIGQHFSRLFTPEDVANGEPKQELQMALAQRHAEDEGWRVRKDGSRFWANVLITALFDDAGRLCGYSKVTRDLTDRRRTEEPLRSVVNHVIDGIIAIDAHGTVQSFNPAAERIFGYLASEVVGQNVKVLMPEPYHGGHDGYLANYLRTGQAKIIGIGREVVGRRKDGSTFPMDLAVSEFRLEQRRFFTGIVRDITERKRLEQELQQRVQELAQADRQKDEFLAMLAHELRNPLAPLRNALQIMKQDARDGAIIAQARAMAERQVQHMARLLDDLLDVSRITRGKIELRKERVELAAVVASAAETSRPLFEAAGHELTVTLPPEPIPLDADLTRLAQVFSNLLNNAAKYTEPGGHIWLTAAVRNQESGIRSQHGQDQWGISSLTPDSCLLTPEVVVKVQDTGLGIPADMLPKIFEMFTQVDRSLERSQGGLGIGLTLVKRLVEMHGGSVEARSDGPGKGSEFTVRLPVAVAEALHQPQPPKGEGETLIAPAKRRILVVDDNKDAADMLSLMLGIMGMEVRTAYDGLEAVEAARAFNPDVVFLDIGMPKLNGYDAARRIREQPWGKDMVLVAVTGWGQQEDRRRSQEAGFNFHMVKPVDPVALERLLTGLKATPS